MDTAEKPRQNAKIATWAGRTVRRAGRVVFTLAVVASAAFAVQFGSGELNRRAETAPSPDPAPALQVKTTSPPGRDRIRCAACLCRPK